MSNPLQPIDTPTEAEIELAASILSRLPGGFLPLPIFHEVARLVTTPTMEVAPMRMAANGIAEILLTYRNDKHWQGWHIPGTVIRSTDEPDSFHTGFQRVLTEELNGSVTYLTEPQYVNQKFWDVARGRELDAVHFVEVSVADESQLPGTFFAVNAIPEDTVEHHKIMIPEIAEAYLQYKSSL